jgi:hypothetical protein
MLPEGTGIDAPQVRGMPFLHQQQLQDAYAIFSPNPRSSNLHFRPVVRNDSSGPLLLLAVVPAVNADGVKDANIAAGPALPQVNGPDMANIANGAHTPFLCLINAPFNALAGAAGGGKAIHRPLANNLLLAHPGEVGAPNNMVAGRQQQSQQHLITNAAMAGVGGIIYLDKVRADLVHHPQNRDNIKAINGINHAMLQTMRMISLAIKKAQPPAASAAIIAPGLNAVEDIASLYTHLASARAAKRMDAIFCYERMINHLERKEEEDLEARLN